MPENTSQPDPWLNLSWNDLDAWAGQKTLARGRKYQYEHRVEDIARASGGELVAWVEGSERYATTITTGDGNLRSWCTCPVGTSCKHAVAVVLEYLESLKNNVPVRTIADNDPRLAIFARFMPGNGTDLPFAKAAQQKNLREISGNRESRCDLSAEEKLHVYFNGLTKADLVEILDKICKEAPEIGQDILARNILVSADPEALLESLVTDIAMLAREPGMEVYGKWQSTATDYSSMNDRMEVLLTSGFADAVLGCGRDLFQFANVEIEEMDENGRL